MKNNMLIAGSAFLLLVLGMVLGFCINRQMMKKRIQEVVKVRHAEGTTVHFYEFIAIPEHQRPQLDPVLRPYIVSLENINWEFTRRRRPVLDSLQRDMQRHLRQEQLDRLERWVIFMKELAPMKED